MGNHVTTNVRQEVSFTTPPIFAVSMSQTEIVRLLLMHGADPSAQDSSGDTAVTTAEDPRVDDTIRKLLKGRDRD